MLKHKKNTKGLHYNAVVTYQVLWLKIPNFNRVDTVNSANVVGYCSDRSSSSFSKPYSGLAVPDDVWAEDSLARPI